MAQCAGGNWHPRRQRVRVKPAFGTYGVYHYTTAGCYIRGTTGTLLT